MFRTFLVLILALAAAPAFADDVPVEPRLVPPLTLEIVAVDIAALGIGALAAVAQPSDTAIKDRIGRGFAAAGGLSFIAAPSVYFAHREYSLGVGSLVIRSVAPFAIGVVGMLGYCIVKDSGPCVTDGLIGATGVGVVTGMALDLALFSHRNGFVKHAPTEWYGWQIIIVDGITAVGAITLAAQIDSGLRRDPDTGLVKFPVFTWLTMWLVGTVSSPVIHFANGQFARGLGSGAMRFLGSSVIGLGGMLGYCAAVGGGEGCDDVGFSWGVLGGSVFIGLLDAFILARKPVDKQPPVSMGPAVFGDGGVGIAIHGKL